MMFRRSFLSTIFSLPIFSAFSFKSSEINENIENLPEIKFNENGRIINAKELYEKATKFNSELESIEFYNKIKCNHVFVTQGYGAIVAYSRSPVKIIINGKIV